MIVSKTKVLKINCLAASNIKDCVLKSDPATSFPLSTSKRSFGFYDILC